MNRPLGITDAEAADLRARPWCDGCHVETPDARVGRLMSRDGSPKILCRVCMVAWYDAAGLPRWSGQFCRRGPDCPACAMEEP